MPFFLGGSIFAEERFLDFLPAVMLVAAKGIVISLGVGTVVDGGEGEAAGGDDRRISRTIAAGDRR